MDCEEYVAVWRYRDHVRAVRAAVARQAGLDSGGPPVRVARDSVGGRFINLARWLLGRVGAGAGDLRAAPAERVFPELTGRGRRWTS